jgi:hypothetical protein
MKKSLQLIMEIGIYLLFTASVSFSQPYFVSVSGTGFVGETETIDYDYTRGYVSKQSSGWLYAQIVFPDDLKYIERMSITFYDFTTTGYIQVRLYKKSRWTDDFTPVATCYTGTSNASNSVLTTSVILGPGRGINNACYNYFIEARFYDSTDICSKLQLHSVTFKCQPY